MSIIDKIYKAKQKFYCQAKQFPTELHITSQAFNELQIEIKGLTGKTVKKKAHVPERFSGYVIFVTDDIDTPFELKGGYNMWNELGEVKNGDDTPSFC